MKNLMMIVVLILVFPVAGCGDQVEQQASETTGTTPATTNAQPAVASLDESAVWRGTVAETMNAGGYTYILLDTGDEQRWVAGPETTVAVGDEVSMQPGMLMTDFHSSAMDRTFEKLYFVGGFGGGGAHGGMPDDDIHAGLEMGGATSEHTTLQSAGVADVEKLTGGVTVAEVHERSTDLAGSDVRLRARVVKYTANIMGTNWVHLQDGTGSEGSHDLTVTTDAVVQVGDLVVVEGKLAVDRDFGAGYRYPVIIEGATVTKE